MRIRELDFTVVSVPYREPERWAWGVREGVTALIVRLEADNGLVGWGESVPFTDVGYAVELLRSFRPLLIGEDPFDVERLLLKLGAAGYQHVANLVLAGVEEALWDLVGKAVDKPLYKLLGGLVRREVPFAPWVWIRRPEEMAAEARQFVEAGFKALYIKVALDPRRDLEHVKAVRAAIGPDPGLRVDANGRWTPGEAIRMVRKMEPYDLEFVEEPTPRYGLKLVRTAVSTPIAAGDSASTPHDILDLIVDRAVDLISHIDPDFQGGILNAKKACAICEMAGIPVVAHTGVDLGLGVAGILHLTASTPNFLYPNQTLYMRLQEDILQEPFQFEEGCLRVPEAPGLGVEPDPKRLERFHHLFEERGAFPAYGSRPPSYPNRPLPPRFWL